MFSQFSHIFSVVRALLVWFSRKRIERRIHYSNKRVPIVYVGLNSQSLLTTVFKLNSDWHIYLQYTFARRDDIIMQKWIFGVVDI